MIPLLPLIVTDSQLILIFDTPLLRPIIISFRHSVAADAAAFAFAAAADIADIDDAAADAFHYCHAYAFADAMITYWTLPSAG